MLASANGLVPSWAYLKDDKMPDGHYDQLGIRWRAGVPFPNQDEKWTGGCYVSWVKIVVSVNPDGTPYLGDDASRIVTLCDALGPVITTDKRIIGLLSDGVFLGLRFQPSGTSKLVFSLDYSTVGKVESVSERKVLGGDKVSGVTVKCAVANIGAVRIKPVCGFSHPWDTAKRRVWRSDVGNSVSQNVAAGWANYLKTALGSQLPDKIN
jgi:hypothetical protein